MIIRHPEFNEVTPILDLFAEEVAAGRMLPRRPDQIASSPMNWWVAVEEGRVIGCVSLVYFGWGLCEVRSLAVHPDYRGRGIAQRLIDATIHSARAQGLRQVLTLTRATRVFERAGFKVAQVGSFPEKVWRDCAACPLRHRCDEVALVYELQ